MRPCRSCPPGRWRQPASTACTSASRPDQRPDWPSETLIDLEWKTAGHLRVSRALPADGASRSIPGPPSRWRSTGRWWRCALEQSGLNPCGSLPAWMGPVVAGHAIYVFRPDPERSREVSPFRSGGSRAGRRHRICPRPALRVEFRRHPFPGCRSSRPAALATGWRSIPGPPFLQQAMDTRSVKAPSSSRPRSGGAIPGDFTWDERSRTATFQPRTRLIYDTEYGVVVTPDAFRRRLPAGEPGAFTFHSLAPGVLSSDHGETHLSLLRRPDQLCRPYG
jgi:hypothetical protein